MDNFQLVNIMSAIIYSKKERADSKEEAQKLVELSIKEATMIFNEVANNVKFEK